MKRGMSLKDKVGAALGRFGSTRRPRAATVGESPDLANTQKNDVLASGAGGGATRPPAVRKSSRPPGEATVSEGAEEGSGNGSGVGGLVRRMSRKLSEDPEKVEARRRREMLYYGSSPPPFLPS